MDLGAPAAALGDQSRNTMQEVRRALTIGGKWIWEHGPDILDQFLMAYGGKANAYLSGPSAL
jgi:hypothetical protein